MMMMIMSVVHVMVQVKKVNVVKHVKILSKHITKRVGAFKILESLSNANAKELMVQKKKKQWTEEKDVTLPAICK